MSGRALLAAVIVLAVPALAHAATYDLGGRWEVESTNPQIQGVCPPGAPFTTFADLVQAGDTFSFDLEASMLGASCSPAAVCQLDGTVAGALYQATSGPIVVDDEGGVAEVEVSFVAASADAASGDSVQTYTLEELVCTWTSDIALTRVPEPASALGAAAALLALAVRRRSASRQ